MKTFLITTTTGDAWEWCGGSYLVIAESTEDAKAIFELPDWSSEKFYGIEEIDTSVKGLIEIQTALVE